MCLSSKEVRLERQYKSLEAGNNTHAMRGCAYWLALSLLYYICWDALPRENNNQNVLGPPT